MDKYLEKQCKKLLTKQSREPVDACLQAGMYADYVRKHNIQTVHVFSTDLINGRHTSSISDATSVINSHLHSVCSIQPVSIIDYV